MMELSPPYVRPHPTIADENPGPEKERKGVLLATHYQESKYRNWRSYRDSLELARKARDFLGDVNRLLLVVASRTPCAPFSGPGFVGDGGAAYIRGR